MQVLLRACPELRGVRHCRYQIERWRTGIGSNQASSIKNGHRSKRNGYFLPSFCVVREIIDARQSGPCPALSFFRGDSPRYAAWRRVCFGAMDRCRCHTDYEAWPFRQTERCSAAVRRHCVHLSPHHIYGGRLCN